MRRTVPGASHGALLRRATPADGPRVAEVYPAAVKHSLPWLRLAHTDEECREWFSGHVVRDLEVWVAEADGTVVAMIVLGVSRSEGEPAWIEHLYVDPPHQGQGIGHRLLQLAADRHPGGLQLWTFQRNRRARVFYEHRGFVAAEFTDGAGNEEREPDVRYLRSQGSQMPSRARPHPRSG
jgi:GNAT superfamily N-acetyltransferase